MRRLLIAATIAALAVVSVPLRAADSLVLSKFSDYLEALRIQTGIPGMAVAIVGQNDIAWEKAFGQQDLDRLVVARTDTPFHLDGLTQTVTATQILHCADEGRLTLDESIARFSPASPDAAATIRQVLTHTSIDGTFSYRPQRVNSLIPIVEWCDGMPLRGSFSKLFDRYAMVDSVPGPDVVALAYQSDGIIQSDIVRYPAVLTRLAAPYAVDRTGRASKSQYPATTLTGAAGLITTVRDYARFDEALKNGHLRFDTLAAAWTPAVGRDGKWLPHGLGWFVQSYNGEKVVWQFGQGDNASSSLVVVLPARALTLVLVANSDGLSRGFGLENGDVTTSPFAKVFLGLFVK